MEFERDLGNIGEAIFEQWCAAAGIVCNKSNNDKTGWDFIVEFPFDETQDTHSTAVECRVQVKSTDSTDRKKQLKLSNLRRLSTALVPTFVLLLEFDGKDQPQRGYLVHVDHGLQTKVLSKIHEKQVDQPAKALNKATMVLTFDDTSLLATANGEALREKIMSHVGSSLATYVEKKTKHLESTGYEDGYGLFNFTISGEEDIDGLVDLSLGFEGSIKIHNLKFCKARFGINEKVPEYSQDFAWLSLPSIKPISKGEVWFFPSDGGITIKIPVNVYSSPFNHVAPEELMKLRLSGDGIEFLVHPFTRSISMTTTLGAGTTLSPAKMRDVLKVVECFRTGTFEKTELHCPDRPTITFPGCTVNEDVELGFDAVRCSNGATACIKILTEFESIQVPISLEELIENSNNFCHFAFILANSNPSLMMEFSLSENKLDLAQSVVIIQLLQTIIGGNRFGILFSLQGTATSISEDRYSLVNGDFKIKKKFFSEDGKCLPLEKIQEAADELAGSYEEDCQVVMLPKFGDADSTED